MKLSNNFTLEELCTTCTHLLNIPSAEETEKLKALAVHVLQPARELLGSSITVNSGFRSPAVNKAVGGVPASQHTKGEAADISCNNNAELFRLIRNNLPFNQLIWEFGDDQQPEWIHVSYRDHNNRNEVLRAVKEKGKTKYLWM